MLLTQYCSGDKIEKNEMGSACSAYWGEERHIRILVGKSEGKRPLGRPRHRCEDIRLDFQEVDRLCGLVVRVSGYRYRGLGFDSQRYQNS